MKKILLIRSSKGLCNRLRVLLSAIAYSEVTNRKLLIEWPKTEDFGAALSDLWEHPYQEVGTIRSKLLVSLAGGYHTHNSMGIGINNLIICPKTIYPFCINDYPASWVSYLSRLRLVNSLEEKIESFASERFHGNIVVGVTIRYNRAHSKTREASPPEFFIRRINEIHEQFPNVLFFLSTDCEEVSQQVHSLTQASICQFPRTYSRNQADSIQGAVCELYLLARTNYILASYWSSFSEMACWMRGESAYENSKSRPDKDLIDNALAAPRDLQKINGFAELKNDLGMYKDSSCIPKLRRVLNEF